MGGAEMVFSSAKVLDGILGNYCGPRYQFIIQE